MDIIEFSRSVNFKLARFLEQECGAIAMSVPFSYPRYPSQVWLPGCIYCGNV